MRRIRKRMTNFGGCPNGKKTISQVVSSLNAISVGGNNQLFGDWNGDGKIDVSDIVHWL